MEELGWRQFHGATDQIIAKHSMDAFWEKAASVMSIHDGHICIYELITPTAIEDRMKNNRVQ
eukprot:3992292-Ditylum_brightwellii.AAC.1